MAAGKDINIKDDILLHVLKHNIKIKDQWRTKEGEIFNVKIFKKLAKYYGIQDCGAIIKEDYTQEEYQTALFNAYNQNKLLIIACETRYRMPIQNQGNSAHWILSSSYWIDENNISYIDAIHHDIYGKWPVQEVYDLNNKMGIENSYGGYLNKFRYTFFTIPIEKGKHPEPYNKPLNDNNFAAKKNITNPFTKI